MPVTLHSLTKRELTCRIEVVKVSSMKGELHLRFTQADVWARGARAAIAQPAPEPRPRLPASTCPFCACVWQRHSAGEPRADTLHARVVGRGPCAGGGGSRLHGASRGSAARRPSPALAAPLRSLLLEERQQRHRSGIMRHLSFWGAVLRVHLYRHKWQGPFFYFLRLNTTQLYVSKPVPLSIVCGWTVGVASASWPR